MSTERKVRNILLVLLPLYLFLVATHQGEFWPFSIFPMFSQAGKPWNHAIAYQEMHSGNEIPKLQVEKQPVGNIVKLDNLPIIQNDFSGLVRQVYFKATPEAVDNLRKIFLPVIRKYPVIIYDVKGELSGAHKGKVLLTYQPLLYISRDTSIVFRP